MLLSSTFQKEVHSFYIKVAYPSVDVKFQMVFDCLQ